MTYLDMLDMQVPRQPIFQDGEWVCFRCGDHLASDVNNLPDICRCGQKIADMRGEAKVKVQLYSPYDHFPNHNAVGDEKRVVIYNDEYVPQGARGSCALMLEPRSILPHVYEWLDSHWSMFSVVFTHDSKLLQTCSNAKLVLWGGVWNWSAKPKTKGISMVASFKDFAEYHQIRKDLALIFDSWDKVDCFGTYKDREAPFVWSDEYLADYKFSIPVENYIDDYWFTEKICNCFANKVVPIYIGAKKIGEFFNMDGIIYVEDWHDIPNIVCNLDVDAEYEKRKAAIDDNYNRVKNFVKFEDWFFRKYDDLLEELAR